MSDHTYELFTVAQEAGANSIPTDVAKAAIHYDSQAHDPLQSVVTLAPVTDREIKSEDKYVVYRVKENGAVLYHEKGPLTLPIGKVEPVVDTIVAETDYIIIEGHEEVI